MAISVCGLILAAGESQRMGSPKQLLPWYGLTLLEVMIAKLLPLPLSRILVVIGHEAEQIRQQIRLNDSRVEWLVHSGYREGQATSLRIGLETALVSHTGVLVNLGDLPLLRAETMHAIYQRGQAKLAEANRPFAIQPVCREGPGHPVFFGHVSQQMCQSLQGDEGGKGWLWQFCEVERLPVDDDGIRFDVDTPERFAAALAMAAGDT